MANFIAFRFCDNDFHSVLRESIEYVVENREEELSIKSFTEFVLRGLVVFNSLRRISNFGANEPLKNHRNYFESTLKITEVNNLSDLCGGFEGFVLDNHTFKVFYYAN